MKKNISKTREQKLAKVINQMDGWIQNNTRLILSIDTPLFHLLLRGHVIGRQEAMFVFDSYGETCRVAVIPEHYDRALCSQKDPASVTFETSGQGNLELREDGREAGFQELCIECIDWMLSNMVAGGDNEAPM